MNNPLREKVRYATLPCLPRSNGVKVFVAMSSAVEVQECLLLAPMSEASKQVFSIGEKIFFAGKHNTGPQDRSLASCRLKFYKM
jgi:hypothetical protein